MSRSQCLSKYCVCVCVCAWMCGKDSFGSACAINQTLNHKLAALREIYVHIIWKQFLIKIHIENAEIPLKDYQTAMYIPRWCTRNNIKTDALFILMKCCVCSCIVDKIQHINGTCSPSRALNTFSSYCSLEGKWAFSISLHKQVGYDILASRRTLRHKVFCSNDANAFMQNVFDGRITIST